ncbi:MAG: GntR family transcriptional regulator [Gordonia sp.]|uniref:GntR family transcriptional regulator n=1 Tax=Gordonia rubripertincta TaxID=36822 RepID=A0ABT4MPN3_GORRU|nr:GntR family transcriptional regulator [Gordonia rubripertincta]MBA4025965.1 GntR family transcriptional regulator [Gordonia sp. (in: high G+C Gram-positive bacteria)]MCZ4548967.1 GntR family transcriptional regulator [Gordonia rubripertincta]
MRRRPQLSEEVAGLLRNRIMSGAIRPGEFIRMDETAVELEVSVTPVREALLTLRGEGMVQLAPHRGYVVAELSRQDVRDIFWLQGVMAVELAIRIAAIITPAQLDQLTRLNEELHDVLATGRASDITTAEFEFHRVHNRIATDGKLAWFLLNATRYTPHDLYANDPEWGQVAYDSHVKLIDAYRRGDRDEVVEQTRRQFTDGAQRLMAHLESIGLWADPEGGQH